MKPGIRALFIHFFAVAFFILVALFFFSPVLQGKTIFQSDIVQFTGMAKEQNDFRQKNDQEPYWTNSAFGGMPTYQLGAYYPYDFVKKLDRTLRFLPRPADYLFLYFLGFYILMWCLKVDYRLAILGALAFGFSTYLIIILGVGHNAKAHAIGYLPMLLGGIVLVFRKKYLWGFLLTALAMALEVGANHYQMTYYFMLLVLVLGAVYLVGAIRRSQWKHFGISVGLLLVAVGIGVAMNATGLMATKEYADWSTRGKSALTVNPDGTPKTDTSGLSKEYITQYSYGISESLNLFVPRLFGGSNSEDLGADSNTYEYLTEQGLSRTRALEFASGLPLYWGDQPAVAGPAYVGAIVFFLFILGLFLVRGYPKWWMAIGALLALMLSWGKNFSLLTDFMIDYFPLYNKFRAVSSIQVILELCVPILGIMALAYLTNVNVNVKSKNKALLYSTAITLGLGLLLLLFRSSFSFSGLNDATYEMYFGNEIMTMIVRDRETVFLNDTLRSLIFVALAALLIWLYLKKRVNMNVLALALGVLIVVDLVGVGRRYVNEDDFVRKRTMREPFQERTVDQQIAQDETIFRVYDASEGINGARTSYFHKSIGGYHAAKPAAMQDLFEYHIYQGNTEVLNMLNVKYLIETDESGQASGLINPDANGNAWFISRLIPVHSADEEIQQLKGLESKTAAIINRADFPTVESQQFAVDSTATIRLTTYAPNEMVYRANNPVAGVAVFSEMYYAPGWQAYIDGKEVPHFRVNYALRALEIPEGFHEIRFEFIPKVVEKGKSISLGSTLLLFVLLIGGIVYPYLPFAKKREP